MQEYGVRDINVTPTRLFELQAQIHVIESDLKAFFVKAADRLKFAFLHHEAGGCDRADDVGEVGLPEIARIARSRKTVRMPGGLANADDHSRVLDASILIKQFRADGAYLRANRVAHHLKQPVPRDYFRVESRAGVRAWLYREGLYERGTQKPQWYLHGLFA